MGSLIVGHDWVTSLSLSLSCTEEGNGPLQRSCLENPRNEGAWWAGHTVAHDWRDLAAAYIRKLFRVSFKNEKVKVGNIFIFYMSVCSVISVVFAQSLQSCLTLCNPHCSLTLLCPSDSPGKNTEMSCQCPPPGDLPDPEIKPGYTVLQADSSLLNH